MRSKFLKTVFLSVLIAPTARAESFSFSPEQLIPDGNISGLSDTHSISTAITAMDTVSVTLDISGTFNGDIYGYLRHGTDIAVLVNRPGKTALDSHGYADSGMSITLTASAAFDVHDYGSQVTLAPGQPLTGIWQADGRKVDPSAALDTDPRTAGLGIFQGANPNGAWTLFLADVSSGGTSTIHTWSMDITAVPEPREYGIVLGMGLAVFAFYRRKQQRAES